MRPTIKLKAHLSVEQLRERLYHSRNGHHASYWQIILSASLNPGKPAREYCNCLGISDTKFYRVVSAYNRGGPDFCRGLSWGGRRKGRCRLSSDEEQELLEGQQGLALEGKVLVAKQLREVVENKTGRPVSDDYLWDLLYRHGWIKKAPRPEHPGADGQVKQLREAFKKKRLSS